MFVCVCVHMCLSAYVCKSTWKRVREEVCVCVCVSVCVCVCVCMCVCVCCETKYEAVCSGQYNRIVFEMDAIQLHIDFSMQLSD